jgi:hypothetical protein
MSAICDYCGKRFCRKWYLQIHIDRIHKKRPIFYECVLCKDRFKNVKELSEHKLTHQLKSSLFQVYKSSLNSITIFRHICPQNSITVDQCFTNKIIKGMENLVLHELNKHPVVKFSIIFGAEYILRDEYRKTVEIETFPIRTEFNFISKPYANDICSVIHDDIATISRRVDDLVHRGSGWNLNDANYIDLEVVRVNPLRGSGNLSCYTDYIIPNSKYVHTVNNNDDFCFLYAVSSAFIAKKYNYTSNPGPYKSFADKYLSYESFSFPLKLNEIKLFERRNEHLDLSINVLFVDYGTDNILHIFPAYISRNNGKNKVNLLLTLNDASSQIGNHYHYIMDVDKFLRKSYVKGLKKSYSKCYFCLNCFSAFAKKSMRNNHEINCKQYREMNIELFPKKEKFRKYNKLGKNKVVGFFDFECANTLLNCDSCNNCPCSCQNIKTKSLKIQTPICYSLIFVDSKLKRVLFRKTYSGNDAVSNFLETLEAVTPDLQRYMKIAIPMNLSDDDIFSFEHADMCYICECKFSIYDIKVRDHDHDTGEFLGAAHQSCNLRRQIASIVPLYCHNFTGYDSHPILQCLAEVSKWKVFPSLHILPKNLQRIRTLRIGIFNLLDSLAFLKTSLDNLVNNLKKDGHIFSYLEQMKYVTLGDPLYETKMDLLTSKGVFPYDHITSLEKLENEISLPDKEAFFNVLKNNTISDSDYLHAQKVFKLFNIPNMKKYMEFYCELDTILLCEVFNKFRDITYNDFQLDPAKFISLPSLAYNAMLKLTNVSIDPLSDIDMYHMIKNGIRGGHSFIAE